MEHKKCPVDRGKLLIGLECCRIDVGECGECPYWIEPQHSSLCIDDLETEALSYISWLEEIASIQEKEIKTLRGAILEIKDCATAALLAHAQE